MLLDLNTIVLQCKYAICLFRRINELLQHLFHNPLASAPADMSSLHCVRYDSQPQNINEKREIAPEFANESRLFFLTAFTSSTIFQLAFYV